MSTIREQIIAALVTRLGTIQTTAGYATNIGNNALRAVHVPDEAQLDYVTAWPRPEEVTRKYGKNICTMPVKIEAAALFGSTDPSVMIEQLLGDLIECITGITWTLPFTAGVTEIVVGQTVTGATSSAAAYVAGVTVSSGTWTGGDAAGTLTLRRQTGTWTGEDINVSGVRVAETTGNVTTVNAVDSAAAGLAEDIAYNAGGPENYPQPGELACGVSALFTITYNTVAGNPFAQPS